jgi:nucleotide-binding universal stress UspA family protein
MTRILVPLDGSSFAENAIHPAAAIARRRDCTLELVSVLPPLVPLLGTSARGALKIQQREAEVREALQRYLDGWRDRLTSADPALQVETAVLRGDAAVALGDHAEATGSRLVVLTSHGRGGPSRLWLGSVTEYLIRRLDLPLLVLRPQEGVDRTKRLVAFSHVLVPLGDELQTEPILSSAEFVAGREGVRYTLLRVVVPLHPLIQVFVPESEEVRDLGEQEAQARRSLAEIAERYRARGFEMDTLVRTSAHIAQEILSVADSSSADLLVLGTHGRGPLGRALVGSVADKVLRSARVPVLVQHVPGSMPTQMPHQE